MKLLPRRRITTVAVKRCWVCDPGSDGPMCVEHTRQVREAAAVQSQPGFRATGQTARRSRPNGSDAR